MILTDAYENTAPAGGASYAPMANLLYGSTEGHTAHLSRMLQDGSVFEEYMSAEPYISNDVVPVVVRTPKIFDALADVALGKRLKQHYIKMMTIAPKTIDGLKRTVNVSFAEDRLNGGGQIFESVSNVTRERAEPTHTYTDRVGKPFWYLLDFIIRYGRMDPETKTPLAVTLPLKPGFLDKGQHLTPDFYTGSMLYFEPTHTGKDIIEAYVCGNMMPKTTGDNTSKRDKGSDREKSELSIPFTSIDISGDPAKAVAQIVLDKMNVFKSNPDKLSAFVNDTDIQKAMEASLGFDEVVR